jgi:hypothetical protein
LRRKLFPGIEINPNQSSKYDDQPKPPSAEAKESPDITAQKFVVLPHHPLYGCQVLVLKRRVATTYVDCTVEDPAHPGFRYHIREWWLSSTRPPSLPISPTPEEAICLPLSALDKMVQRLLTTPYFRRITDDEQADHASPSANADPGTPPVDLVPPATDSPNAAEQSSFLPGTRKSRRD